LFGNSIRTGCAQLGPRFFYQIAARITAQQLFKSGAAVRVISEVILINFANGEERFDAMLAARILAAQVFVFANGGIEGHVIFEMTAHFGGQLGDGECAAVSFAGSRRFKNDAPVGRDYSFVFVAAAGLLRSAIQSFALAFSFGVLGFGPGLRAMHTCM